ncbi:MAG TPA: S9 family peptidase, partial [Chromatiales bacterium]|nr:S9 family peptidase [Chromatiales bacterium]
LMSAIENPGLYNCVVSIAGVVDPEMLIEDKRIFLNKKAVREFVGGGDEVFEQGSPLYRAGEITVPVLLFHGDEDINVSVRHSKTLYKRLKKLKKPVDLAVYDDAEHSLWSNRARIDMLTRLGDFLDRNTRAMN